MSNYIKATNFRIKDTLITGDPNKRIKGAELDDELNAIASAITSKANTASPAFIGTPTAPTPTPGNDSTQIATTAFFQDELASYAENVNITGGSISDVAISGGTITELDTPLLVSDGGTSRSTLGLNSVLLGNGINPINSVAPGSAGNVLVSNGTTWVSGQSGIGEAQALSFNTDYTADASGFIVANANNNFSINSGFTVTVAGNVIVNTRTTSEGAVGFVTGTSPVAKGQTWRAQLTGGASAISLWFIPLGN